MGGPSLLEQNRLHLLARQRRLHSGGDLAEVGHQGAGLVGGVVLAEGDEKHIPAVEQNPQVGGGRAQAVVGGRRQHQGPAVAQVGFSRHGDGGIGDAVGQLAQGIARAGAHDQHIQQPLGPDGLRPGHGGYHPPAADALHLPHEVVGRAEAGVGARHRLGHDGGHRPETGGRLFQGVQRPVHGAEGPAEGEAHTQFFEIHCSDSSMI